MNRATLDFANRHANDDVRQLALRGAKDPDVDLTLALQQIQGRQTAHRKLPSWAAIDGLLYPPHLNMEQCSSEQTARYKANLCRRLLSTPHLSPLSSQLSTLYDLTGGFGVDFAFMSEAFSEATYVERHTELFAISSANFLTLGLPVKVINDDGIDVLHTIDHATMIYLDPARRNDYGARTFGIADCTPNILEIKDTLLEKADFVVLKLSPMLDWRKAVADLGPSVVSEVHIVAVDNECKELLVVLSQHPTPLRLICSNNAQLFETNRIEKSDGPPKTEEPEGLNRLGNYAFLYEPNAAIMKAGCFVELSRAYRIKQIAPNSHLFVADRLIDDFPGRCFQIAAVSSMNKKELKRMLADVEQANITTRNFPLTVAELRKRLKIGDGGSVYLFATTMADGDHAVIKALAPTAHHADYHHAL